MAIEIWKSVRGFEKSYEVSSFGNVRSLPRFRGGKNNSLVPVFGKILRSGDCNGYRNINLGKGTTVYVHRLVAEEFIPNPESLPEVNHVDGNKSNNCVSNLEWISHIENAKHASRAGLLATGLRHGRHTKPEAFNGN